MNSETKEDFYSAFANFFDIMGSQPQTIMTDQQLAIIGALKDLKDREEWSGAHLLDTFHILKNLRKKTTKNKKLFEYLHTAMFQKTLDGYDTNLKLAKLAMEKEEDGQVVAGFESNANMHCISLTP